MTNNPFTPNSNDLSVRFISPSNPTDPRTVLAEEFSLNSQLAISLFQSNRKSGWVSPLELSVTAARSVRIKGYAVLKIHPQILNINHEIIIPGLPDTTSLVRRDENISLIGLGAEVGESQDTILGQVGFKYEDTLTNTIKEITKENARRYRSFWLVALHTGTITPENIWTLLTTELDGKKLLVTNIGNTGFALGSVRLYALDPNWTTSSYAIIPNSIEIIPTAFVSRLQNYKDDGYIYGNSGEEPLSELFISNLSKLVDRADANTIIHERILQIAKGIPGRGSKYKRSVKNLIPGEYGSNVGRPGASSDSPNGSICIANDQRITFTNQSFQQQYYVMVATANTDGNGRAVVGVGINTNAPSGTRFSPRREDHKIYSAVDGKEQSDTGKFSNLGGTGSLNWGAGNNSTINPGNKVLFVPAIQYPSGSGLSLPFSHIEKAWLNGTEISSGNIRDGYSDDIDDDIGTYEDPINNESYIIVYGSERGAIHYIYKKVNVTANSSGIATIPTNSDIHQGCFAFVEGVSGRINSPVIFGITAGQTRKALIYYPPKYNEVWQFQMISCEYQGRINQESNFLDGATIISYPKCYLHTSGGGLSVHRGDRELAASLIASQMPRVPNPPVKPYNFDNPIYFPGEQYPGPISWRGEDIPMWNAPGFAFPYPGQRLTIVGRQPTVLSHALNAKLYANHIQIAVRIPAIISQASFQSVVCFLAAKENNVKLVVATQNIQTSRPHNMIFDIAANTAIDIFEI